MERAAEEGREQFAQRERKETMVLTKIAVHDDRIMEREEGGSRKEREALNYRQLQIKRCGRSDDGKARGHARTPVPTITNFHSRESLLQ